MSLSQKDFLAKWLPLIFSVAVNLALVAYGYGKMDSRISAMETQVAATARDKLVTYLVTRAEFDVRVKQRDQENDVQNAWLLRIETKLDRVLERQYNDKK